MRYLLDTNVLIHYLRQSSLAEYIERTYQPLVPFPHPKAHLFAAAQKKIYQHMMDEMTDIRTNLTQLKMDIVA